MSTVTPAEAWDRKPGEPARAYAAFRIYRDLAPTKRNLATVTDQVGGSERRTRAWAQTWNWRDRCLAWDDACHQLEDQERLEAIRQMHSIHRRAGRAAVTKAVQALSALNNEDMSPSMIARFLELGARLERSTLVVSVEELQGLDTRAAEDDEEDPWTQIARELDPNNSRTN